MVRSTYSLRNLSHQKYRKESENWKLWDCLCILRSKASYVNDSPKETPNSWYNMHDVSRGSMPTDEFLYRLECTQRLLSVKLVGKGKYCQEISKTWERLACSHNLYFLF